MGAQQSVSKQMPTDVKYLTPDDSVEDFDLKKQRPGCTGMFWRPDPTGQTSLSSNSDWPRDGAKLRGRVVEVDGKRWLLAKEVMQKSSRHWVAAPKGAAMPFEYDNHYFLAASSSPASS